MIEFTDIYGILHLIPIREVRRVSIGPDMAGVYLRGEAFDLIEVSIESAQAIRMQLRNKHIEG